MKPNSVKRALKQGKVQIGTWVNTLSTDFGCPGQTNHPDVLRSVELMIAACRRHDKIPGLLVQDVASAKTWIAKGIRLVPYSNEVAMLMPAATHAVGQIRAFAEEEKGER
jgi:2-keto-3-deoxy-L-rhamnonate aldolase RhmA